MIFNTLFYWGTPAKLFHWAAAAMILFLYVHGLWVGDEGDPALAAANTYQIFLHAAVGVTLAVLMFGRFAWRLINKIPMLPAKTPELEKRLAGLAHIGLYLATAATIVAGWLLAGARNPAVNVKLLGLLPVPTVSLGSDKATIDLLVLVHKFSAHLLILIVAAHVVAALWHHFVQRDSVLQRMLLRGRNRTRQQQR